MRTSIVGVLAVFWLADGATLTVAAYYCPDWNSRSILLNFFVNATIDDVTACPDAGAGRSR